MFIPIECRSRDCMGFIIALVVLQFACSKKSPSEPVLDLSEDRGIALTEKDEQINSLSLNDIVWSADGQEIFYVSSPQSSSSSRVRAVKVADKSNSGAWPAAMMLSPETTPIVSWPFLSTPGALLLSLAVKYI